MTPRQRLLTVLRGEVPDCVPVAPDISNMIPARLTGKPFWDLYLYRDPPPWEAYIAAARYFDIDSLMDGYFPLTFPEEINPNEPDWETFIVQRRDDRLVTQRSYCDNGRRIWEPHVNVYHVADSPAWQVAPSKANLPETPTYFEPLENAQSEDRGPVGLTRAKKLMGDQGLVGVFVTSSLALTNEDDIYAYYDMDNARIEQLAHERLVRAEARFNRIMALDDKPDFLCVGGSGTLVFQTLDIFCKLAFPAVKRVIDLASAVGMPTHLHSCGPEAALVKLMAEETDLTVIDPLEISPMGDCDLADLKKHYGDKIVLKGNLHTTDIMLRGTADDVRTAAQDAIDDAAGLPGTDQTPGRFILSTGDQCGRDTPDDNLHALVETARIYGKYT